MAAAVYKVDGMTCGGCAAGVTRALLALNGQAKVNADFKQGTVTVDGLTAEQVRQGVDNAGFDFIGPMD